MAVLNRLPEWFTVRAPSGEQARTFRELTSLMRDQGLHTICEEAHCPNITECWSHGTATFLILGDVCTRACSYCAVTSGKPGALDPFEPARLLHSVKTLNLKHVVITSVNRDDLEDGGAEVFVRCVNLIHRDMPETTIELLIPDFMGDEAPLRAVLAAGPDVLNHNIETVRRLFPKVRHKGDFDRSIELLRRVKEIVPGMRTKSGLMLGLGEEREEVLETLQALRSADVDVLTLGQYLQPTRKHTKIERFVTPEEFGEWRETGLALGFRHVESGPLVRSSYHAHEHAPPAKELVRLPMAGRQANGRGTTQP